MLLKMSAMSRLKTWLRMRRVHRLGVKGENLRRKARSLAEITFERIFKDNRDLNDYMKAEESFQAFSQKYGLAYNTITNEVIAKALTGVKNPIQAFLEEVGAIEVMKVEEEEKPSVH